MDTIKQIIDKFNLISKKSLGQNFILDENITDKIVRTSDVKNHIILEIGPGPGCLTRSLIKAGVKKIIAVEKDLKCVKIINYQKKIFLNKVVVIEGDFLKDHILRKTLREFKKYKKKKAIVFSNLPYKTAIPILSKIFKNRSYFQKLILMFQKEQAERIMAKKNTKTYGRISVMSNWLCDIKKKMHLSPNYFFPRPKIDSSILEFKFKKKIMKVDNEDLLSNVIKLCFSQRRKTIKNNLKKINFSEQMFLNCGINSKKRPEELDFLDFINLSNFLSKYKKIL